MALLLDRSYGFRTISDYFLSDVSEKGRVLVYGPGGGSGTGDVGGSGVILENTSAVVSIAGNPSGLKPAGLLLNKQVSRDLSRDHLNWHQDEMPTGGKCLITREGRFYTNLVVGSPVAGDKAYLTSHGRVTPTLATLLTTPLVGEFFSSLDENGYAGFEIKLP